MIIAAIKLDPLPLCCLPPKSAAKAAKATRKLKKGIQRATCNMETYRALLDGVSAFNAMFVPCGAFMQWRDSLLNQLADSIIEVAAAIKAEPEAASEKKRRKAPEVH